jgi:glycosyltransferase involved in cell wall biosynthesis
MEYLDIATHARSAERIWSEAYDILWKIINKKKLKIGAEIGVAFGGHSERILEKTKVKLFCIDPYQHIDGYVDAMNLPQPEFNRLFNFTKKRLSIYGKRCVMVRKTSEEAVKVIKNVLDFVYIDADHSYEGVKRDLISWFPKIKDGGVLSGHDYNHPNFPGVKQAIDEFFTRFNWEIHTNQNGVWWVEKEPLNISYIIPAYNCADTIEASVKSIFRRNFEKNDELIIVDDHSTDSTLKIIKQIAIKHPEVRVFTHTYNKGGGATRNTAIENAQNQLIFCLDSDNILETYSISKLKKYLIQSGAEICSFEKLKYFNNKTTKISHEWKFSNRIYDKMNYLSTNIVPGASGNYLFTKQSWEISNRYPEFAGALDTWGFGLRQVMAGCKIFILPNSYYYHRIGYESYWVRDSKKNNASLVAMQLLIPYFDEISESDIDYLSSRKYRKTWLGTIDKRPIKVITQNEKRTKAIINLIRRLI